VRVGVGAAIVLVLIAIASAVLVAIVAPRGETAIVAPSSTAEFATAPPTEAASSVFVHVLGAVGHPGLYELSDGDRAVDAVAAAGGFAEDADEAFVNLARIVTDGEQLYIPKKGEARVVGGEGQGAPAAGGSSGGGPGGSSVGGTAGGAVNINTADATQLETLPGIGPAMAERIISWREDNGAFTSVDDLLSVAGIGQKTLESLRDLVTV
jgi:competence protein ComEA